MRYTALLALTALASTAIVTPVYAQTLEQILRQPSADSAWLYYSEYDPMTGTAARFAQLSSQSSMSLDFPYQSEYRAVLIVRERPGYRKDVMLWIDADSLLLADRYDAREAALCETPEAFEIYCKVTVRFEGGEVIRWGVEAPNEYSPNVFFLRDYDRFVGLAVASRIIHIELPIFRQGNHIFKFVSLDYFDYETYKDQTCRQNEQGGRVCVSNDN